jgi:hypothetical protein
MFKTLTVVFGLWMAVELLLIAVGAGQWTL